MKITQLTPLPKPESPLETFSKQKFTLELNGLELLALKVIAGKIGGIGAVRSLFSWCSATNRHDNISAVIENIPGSSEALAELYDNIQIENNTPGSIFINDNLVNPTKDVSLHNKAEQLARDYPIQKIQAIKELRAWSSLPENHASVLAGGYELHGDEVRSIGLADAKNLIEKYL